VRQKEVKGVMVQRVDNMATLFLPGEIYIGCGEIEMPEFNPMPRKLTITGTIKLDYRGAFLLRKFLGRATKNELRKNALMKVIKRRK